VTDLTHAAFAALVVFLAYVVRGIAGSGSGLIAVPILSVLVSLILVASGAVLLIRG
jgi:uncharacterized membrane protein YfcA